MPFKHPASAICAHCRSARAAAECAGCGMAVCDRCAGGAGCPEPRALELRLGLGARLRYLDRSGDCGVVSNWRGRAMWLDLDAAILGPAPAWLQAARGKQSFGPIRTPSQRSRRGAPLRLLRGRRILTPWAELRDVGDGRAWVVVGSQLFDRSGALLRRFKKDHPLVPGRLGAFACALTSVESVALVDLNGGSRCVYQPEARQEPHAQS